MNKAEIILEWINEQMCAGKIKPSEGRRLAGLVDMTDCSNKARFMYFVIKDAAPPHRKGRKPQEISPDNIVSEKYDTQRAAEIIRYMLTEQDPRPTVVARFARDLILEGIFRKDLEAPAIFRFLQSLDTPKREEWGNLETFRKCLRPWGWDTGNAKTLARRDNIGVKFRDLYD